MDGVRQTKEGAIFLAWDKNTNLITSRLHSDDGNNYKTANHEATTVWPGGTTTIADNKNIYVLAEMHTHETVPIDPFKAQSVKLGKDAISEDIGCSGMSEADMNFMIKKGNIPVYAIDKLSTKSKSYGDVYRISEGQNYLDTKSSVMHTIDILSNPMNFIKDAIRKNK